MLKKRLIFTLLYNSGIFSLSRNFRLQDVGDIKWLNENYNFDYISKYIDELIVLDVSRSRRDINAFSDILKKLTEKIFVPISSGGGIRKYEDAKILLDSGADKVIINSSLFTDQELIFNLSSEFGRQCLVGSLDIKKEGKEYEAYIQNGTKKINKNNHEILSILKKSPIGEIMLHSIDRDGTGQGFDFDSLLFLNNKINLPVIISGGAGNGRHLVNGLKHERIDAVSSSHLFNFIGDGLKRARQEAKQNKIELANW
tara:strand:- start:1781 stop:2548 length:768 start_codon:yes stop_codon:yes gene_type:complete